MFDTVLVFVEQIIVRVAEAGTYTVRLYFAEPDTAAKPGSRVFDVTLADEKVLSRFDILAAGKGVPRTTLIKEFKGVGIRDTGAILRFNAHIGAPIISGVELVLEP